MKKDKRNLGDVLADVDELLQLTGSVKKVEGCVKHILRVQPNGLEQERDRLYVEGKRNG